MSLPHLEYTKRSDRQRRNAAKRPGANFHRVFRVNFKGFTLNAAGKYTLRAVDFPFLYLFLLKYRLFERNNLRKLV